jgi:hypothetical protein
MSGIAGMLMQDIVRPWWDERWVTKVIWQFALIPLAWLVVLLVRRERPGAAWWWMAGAFAVSWLADAPVDSMPRAYQYVPPAVYPVVQSSIFGRVLLLHRRHAITLLGVLSAGGLIAVLWNGVKGPDVLLHTVAFLAVVVIVANTPELPARLQVCLLVYFGLGWVTWVTHFRMLTLATYYPYQSARLAGLLLFCFAAMKPGTTLRLVRSA